MSECRTFKINKARLNVVSSGGGTQSTAIICMIHAGLLPKPDLIVMADTERESSYIIPYQEKYIKPLCDEIGLEYHIVKKSDYSKEDIFSKNGKQIRVGYFSEWNGKTDKGHCTGKLMATCSDQWKTQVIRRFLNKKYGQSYLNKRGVDFWIGYSIDEIHRLRTPVGKWQNRFPLIELLVNRQQAIQFVEKYGLPLPQQSACWMCPNRHAHGWAWMKEHAPEDFKRAVEHEKLIQQKYPHLWLTRYAKPLDHIDFSTIPIKDQLDLIDVNFCGSSGCYI